MINRQVMVLMSTFNGEKYVSNQLDSILNQTYENMKIHIRDDGSTDHTVDILRQYEQQGKIVLEAGENIGLIRSFHWLVENCEKSDYYSFADQDDEWNADKVERAVHSLDKTGQSIPALYFCDFDYYDCDLNFLYHKKPLKRELHFLVTLSSIVNYGFTTVINDELRKLFMQMPADAVFGHDYLALLIASAFGSIYYDTARCAKYRRHGKTASISGAGFIKLSIWRIKNVLFKDNFRYKDKWAQFYSVYNDILSEDIKSKLVWFASRYRVDYAFKKALYPRRYRETFFDEIAIRVLFLLGRL